MPEHDDLTRLFPTPGDARIDTDDVIRRARRRRLPRQIVVGGVTAVAVVGLVVGGGSLLRGVATSAGTSASSADSAAQPEAAGGGAADSDDSRTDAAGTNGSAATGDGTQVVSPDTLNPCAAPLADVTPSSFGLVLTTHFPSTIEEGAEFVEGTVTITNTGDEPVTGTTASTPAITLSQSGTTIWHSNGATDSITIPLDLEPGESSTYSATLIPDVCGEVDEELESFRDDLPAAEPGEYDVSAAIRFTPADAAGPGSAVETISSSVQAVTIR